jgi:sulfur transfer protein SufE
LRYSSGLGADMDAKIAHELVLLVAISLLSGTTALAVDDVVFTGVFAALGIAATLSAWHRS